MDVGNLLSYRLGLLFRRISLICPSPDENQKNPCGRLLPNLFGHDCLTA